MPPCLQHHSLGSWLLGSWLLVSNTGSVDDSFPMTCQVKAEKPAWYLAMISGALLRTLDFVSARSAEYMGYLEKGQLPPARLTLTSFEESFVLEGALPALAWPGSEFTVPLSAFGACCWERCRRTGDGLFLTAVLVWYINFVVKIDSLRLNDGCLTP